MSSQMGQTKTNSVRAYVFRFALKLGHRSAHSGCLKGAITGSDLPIPSRPNVGHPRRKPLRTALRFACWLSPELPWRHRQVFGSFRAFRYHELCDGIAAETLQDRAIDISSRRKIAGFE